MRTPADLDALAGELVIAAGRLVREIRRASPDAAALRLLALLDDNGPSTIGHIALRDGITQPSATNAVNRLESRGWLRRRPHPNDARAVLVDLTDAGRGALRELRAGNAALVRERILAAGLDSPEPTDDLERAVRLLRALSEGEE